MNFVDFFKNKFEDLSLSLWEKSEQAALMRVIYGIYVSDNEFDKLEAEHFNSKLDALGLNGIEVEKLTITEALDILAGDKLKNALLYTVMAEALFKDDDYDNIEQAYVDAMKAGFAVNEAMLDAAIKKVRDKKLEVVLRDWVTEIDNTSLKADK